MAICLMPLPIAEMADLEKGEYRYGPLDENRISQFGFVANGISVEQNYWVPLGVVKFQGAMNGFGLAIATAVASVALMTVF